jgi:hypothetical protein
MSTWKTNMCVIWPFRLATGDTLTDVQKTSPLARTPRVTPSAATRASIAASSRAATSPLPSSARKHGRQPIATSRVRPLRERNASLQ